MNTQLHQVPGFGPWLAPLSPVGHPDAAADPVIQIAVKWWLDLAEKTLRVVHDQLMERVLERDNLRRAFRQVKRNKGSAGIDDLTAFVQQHWFRIGVQLLAGTYRPQPVRQVEIPKPKGGVRK